MINSGSYLDRLTLANHVLYSIKNLAEMAQWFNSLGFGPAEVSAGLNTYEAAGEALSQSVVSVANRMEAVDHKRLVFSDARQRHSAVVQMARMVISDQESRLRLGLKGRQPEAVDTWHGYAACFYQALLPEDMERLERVGITPQRIDMMRELLDLSIAATAATKAATAAAVKATVELKAAFKALAGVMADISVMARVGEAGKTNLAALLKLTKRRRRGLPPFPGITAEEDTEVCREKASMWTWFDLSPEVLSDHRHTVANLREQSWVTPAGELLKRLASGDKGT